MGHPPCRTTCIWRQNACLPTASVQTYLFVLSWPCSEDDTEGKVVDTELFMDVVPRAWIKAGIIDKGGEGGGAARSGGGGGGAELQELSPLPCTAEGPDDPSNASELKEV